MNSVLLQSPASTSGIELRGILLAALGGRQDLITLIWYDSKTVAIPEAGIAPGTGVNAGKQIIQLLYAGDQSAFESDLQNALLQAHQVVGFQSMLDEYQGLDGNNDPIYAPTVTTAIEVGTLQYLSKQYSDEAQTIEIPKNVNWFPKYLNQVDWITVL